MDYVIVGLFCFAGGALATFLALDAKRRGAQSLWSQQEQLGKANDEKLSQLASHGQALQAESRSLEEARRAFDDRVVSFDELQRENVLLKSDLGNIAATVRKQQLDRAAERTERAALDAKSDAVGAIYLKESVKWIGKTLNASNYALCKKRLLDVIERCRGIGLAISSEKEEGYVAELRADFEKEVRAALEREEQTRIRAQIREEQKLEREIQKEQERIDRERAVLQEALAHALATTQDQHSAEIESLTARLAEAEERQRAISQAQLTKSGFVYVISNLGSFGDGVYKVGMTRRLEPLDRVRELGDASVPFPFDVHMMISCENAPALENALHKALVKQQVNKTNPRKEFFRVDLETITTLVRDHHGEVEYVADAEALEYRQSQEMSDEDVEFVDHVFDELDDDENVDFE